MHKPGEESHNTTSVHEPAQIIAEHRSWAYKIASGFQKRGLPLEDLHQEALLGLLDAAENFQPELGVQFTTYAFYWVKKRILAALESENTGSMQSVPLEDQHLAGLHTAPDTQLRDLAALIPKGIPAEELQVVLLSLGQQLTIKETAQAMGIPPERVRQLRAKALRRIRKEMGNNFLLSGLPPL